MIRKDGALKRELVGHRYYKGENGKNKGKEGQYRGEDR